MRLYQGIRHLCGTFHRLRSSHDEARREKSKFIVDSVIPSLENAVRLHELDDDIEGILRSKVLIANFYDLLGEITRARELAAPCAKDRGVRL